MLSFMLELTKKLDMRYKSPPLPVLLSYGYKEPGNKEPTKTIEGRYGFEQNEGKESDAPWSPKSVGTVTSEDVASVMNMFDKM
jgi:hypothetical protein